MSVKVVPISHAPPSSASCCTTTMPAYFKVGDTVNYNFFPQSPKTSKIGSVDTTAGYPIYRVEGEWRPVLRHNINYRVEDTMTDQTAPPDHGEPALSDSRETPATSRFVFYEENEIDAFRSAQENPSTARKTLAHVTLLKEYLSLKNENRSLHMIPPAELDSLLCGFFAGVRKSDGSDYEPNYLKNIQNSIERHLKNRGYSASLTNDRQFHNSRETLKAKQVELRKAGKGNNPFAADPLSTGEVDQLWERGQLGSNNPETLIQTLWWVNTTQFGMRAGEKEHLQLRFGDIQVKTTHDGQEYLERLTERQTKTRTGTDPNDVRVCNPRAYATGDERCPVMLFKKFKSLRPDDFCKDDDAFYIGTIQNPRPGQKWFRRQNLGPNKLSGFMRKMVAKSGLSSENSKRLTNTSARKFLVQTLNDAQIPPTQIQQITGHKNIQSINKYSKLNDQQKENVSLTINNPQKRKSDTLACTTTCHKVANYTSENTIPVGGNNPLSFFAGAHITGGTININIAPAHAGLQSASQTLHIEQASQSHASYDQ